ncbi:MAG TPA: hypothetical protein VM802_14645 [Chitinophaga sp.]|uniref:hypothetical protein n=1 Tax=Chitinophaga sp. TaxID=1869181 RepID=UPI002C64F25A|nr:hypothetical protein [Chitinophaga sp.]HVI46111.1 hypothetical protein [Chitinophaga sp.]
MKALVIVMLSCLPLIVSAQQEAGKGILIKPATIDFTLTGGQTGNGKVFISNNLNKKKQFTVYLSDWIRDTQGKHVYTQPGSTTRSCANWVKVDKTFIEVDPGQTAELNIKLLVPDSAAATAEMKWAMLFVETIEEQVVRSATGLETHVNNKMRVGIHLYQTPPSITDKDVKIIAFEQPKASERKCHIVCQNTGGVQLECNSYIELSNTLTGDKTRIDASLFPLFPGQKRIVEFVIPDNVPKGKYSLVGIIDAGNDVPMEAAQAMVDI